jgi:hypothetical protein
VLGQHAPAVGRDLLRFLLLGCPALPVALAGRRRFGSLGLAEQRAREGFEDELNLPRVDPFARRLRFVAKPLELGPKSGGLLLELVALTLEPRPLLGQPVALVGERRELPLERTEALFRAR